MLKIGIETNIFFLNHLCRNWTVVSSGGITCHVNGILGLLCKTHFPGLVDYAKKRELAYTFDRYANAPDAEAENKMVRVKRAFWVSLHRRTLLNTSHSLDFS
jgi:hypothetical protein